MIIGTAGHIDHGKSALVEALTGGRMDPHPEERRRGITLDLHFAAYPLADGRVAGVIDVPGHEDLVRTMIAGAAGIDLALLVIAADEGIMPQTREHLSILEQLEIPAGIPVLTKADLVDEDWLALVQEEVGEYLGGSSVPFSPPLPVSAHQGRGIPELRARIEAALAAPPRALADDLLRLPVDRVFTLPGTGTVVTGTIWSGRIKVGDEVLLLPSGETGRVRTLEQHGQAVETVGPGNRVAAGLAGIERTGLHRGETLVHPGRYWEPTTALDLHLRLDAAQSHPLTHHQRVRLHLGTAEVLGRLHLGAALLPGEEGFARVSLEAPLLARGGDRIVMRSYSPVATIGGGWVLDPRPSRARPDWDPALAAPAAEPRLGALLRRRPEGLPREAVPVIHGVPVSKLATLLKSAGTLLLEELAVAAEQVAGAARRGAALVEAWHLAHPVDAGMPLQTWRSELRQPGEVTAEVLRRMSSSGRFRVEEGLIRRAEFRAVVSGGEALVERVVSTVEAAGLSPPDAAELATSLGLADVADALRLAARGGRLVAVERDRYYATSALERFRTTLAELAAREDISPQALRQRLGLSRKFLIPLLEWADTAGYTIRRGEGRVAGPALGRPG